MIRESERQDAVGHMFGNIGGVRANNRSSDRCRVCVEECGSLRLMFPSCCRHSLLSFSLDSSRNFISQLDISNVFLVSSGLSSLSKP